MWRMSRRQRARLERLKGWAGSIEGYEDAFTADEVKAFQQRLHGDVVLPADASYHASRQLTNYAFQSFPLLIVYCEVMQDVWESLAFAQTHALWITTRSGGHSTAGFSVNDGMVIDTSRMNGIHVDAVAKRAVLGPGTTWGQLNVVLAGYGLHMPTGGCGDVCVAGYMQGGGYGFTSRKFGINCDSVIEMLVMLADGRVVRANAGQNADLFWAMRGGTGNNFGILLEATYELHEMPPLWGFGLQWPLEKAAEALQLWQKGFMRHGAPPELGYMGVLANTGDKLVPQLLMCGIWWGSRAEGMKQIKPLLESGATIFKDKVGTYNDLNEWLLENIPPCPDLAREDKQSVILAQKLSLSDWKRVVKRFAESPNPWTAVVFEPYGGAINALPRDANAFVHRDADCDVFVDVFWMDPEQERQAKQYLDDYMALLDPLGNGESYQNYPRITQKDYRRRYWGEQFERLLAIKHKYDPKHFFRYAQDVSPEPGQHWPRRAKADKADKADRITVEPWSPAAIAVKPTPSKSARAAGRKKKA
jgi:FAD/FMN-containing dehydrogenase